MYVRNLSVSSVTWITSVNKRSYKNQSYKAKGWYQYFRSGKVVRYLIVFIIKALPLACKCCCLPSTVNKNGSAAFLKTFSLEVLGSAQHSFWETLRKMTKKAISFSFPDSNLVSGLQCQLHKDIYLPKAPTIHNQIWFIIIYIPPQIPTLFLIKPAQSTLKWHRYDM